MVSNFINLNIILPMTAYKDKYDYIRRVFAVESAEIRAARASLTDNNDQISLEPEEGRLLQILIRLSGVKKIVEIGTLGGCSALWMAEALPEDGTVVTIEKDPARAEKAKKNTAANKKIFVIEGDALRMLDTIAQQAPFDMVFIDADKLNYLHYLEWVEKNIRKGGLIVADNTLLFGAAWDDAPHPRVRETARQAIRAFNLRLADPSRYLSILLPTEQGMTIAQKLF